MTVNHKKYDTVSLWKNNLDVFSSSIKKEEKITQMFSHCVKEERRWRQKTKSSLCFYFQFLFSRKQRELSFLLFLQGTKRSFSQLLLVSSAKAPGQFFHLPLKLLRDSWQPAVWWFLSLFHEAVMLTALCSSLVMLQEVNRWQVKENSFFSTVIINEPVIAGLSRLPREPSPSLKLCS